MEIKDRTVIVGVTGSIAAYKAADTVSKLVKAGCDVYVIMTKNAVNFINPITFETLTGHKCLVDTFDRNFNFNIEHVSLASKADVCIIAPATANVIGKLACGIADDMLTTTVMAAKCPKLIAPAMNTGMYDEPVVQDNLIKLKGYGYEVIEPDDGRLACGVTGRGRLPDTPVLMQYIYKALQIKKDFKGKNIVVTAGPTKEPFDPVRYITNHSTGTMGYAVAKAAWRRGARVTLISGTDGLPDPEGIDTVHIQTAEDMFSAVREHFSESDILIKAAAVADYTPVSVSDQKIKKSDDGMQAELKRTTDILSWAGEHKGKAQFVCGFAMETEDLIERAKEKLEKKNADMIVANDLRTAGAGFGGDTNVITIITADGVKELPIMSKDDAADEILDEIAASIKAE